MTLTLFASTGGTLALPARGALLLSREDGGNLVVHPPRPVWERGELDAGELAAFSFLAAACGAAMIAALPQLEGGCVNYWEAGNWALNDAAEPKGPKTAPAHRRMHLHLIGRSRFSTNPNAAWGESPRFPMFAEKESWARAHQRLTPDECAAIVAHAEQRLRTKYALAASDISPWSRCPACDYPNVAGEGQACTECAAS